MFSRTTFVVSAFAAALAANLCLSGQAVSGEPVEGDALYRPIQSISYTVGSKIASGYFVQQNSVCRVTLMIAEKIDPGLPSPTAARVRVMLDPGQVVGLDTEEGRSLNFTCGEGAATLGRQLWREGQTYRATRSSGNEHDCRAGPTGSWPNWLAGPRPSNFRVSCRGRVGV